MYLTSLVICLAATGYIISHKIIFNSTRYSQNIHKDWHKFFSTKRSNRNRSDGYLLQIFWEFQELNRPIVSRYVPPKYKVFEIICTLIFISCGFTLYSDSIQINRPESIIKGVILLSILMFLVLIDLDQMRLPTDICMLGVLLGISITFISSFLIEGNNSIDILLDHILAVVWGFATMRVISSVSKLVTKRECLGLGDANLVALGGSWIGSKELAIAMSIAFIAGALYSLIALLGRLMKPTQPFPFGAFIAGGIWGVWCSSTERWWLN